MNKLSKTRLAKTCSGLSLLILSNVTIVFPMGSADAQGVTLDPSKIIVGTQDDADAEAPEIASSGRNVYIIWHEASDASAAAGGNVHEVWLSRSNNRVVISIQE